ncbi:MAG: nitrogenase component 1 [Bacillota bacterium]|jgi:nitrogenase molybdenum-cofactor synthesis protein NifE
MKQTAKIISTYTADVSGVCSALFELGGMVVMHDASGCNSTYNTHDEPRWYDMDSLVFISALSEIEAIMGDDEKLINDIVEAAKDLQPNFIAVAGTPIPMMIGTDFSAVAKVIEERTGIPAFGISTNGMHSYISGAGMAFEILAERMVEEPNGKVGSDQIGVNIIGATPLDFSVNGSVDSVKELLSTNGFEVISTWAMGDDLSAVKRAGSADVNLVISACGLPAAEVLRKRFGISYVVGLPVGSALSRKICADLGTAVRDKVNIISYSLQTAADRYDYTFIGEGVYGKSLAFALQAEYNKTCRVICPVDCPAELLGVSDLKATDEEEIAPYFSETEAVVADPLYRPICPDGVRFAELPHEGFSGRIFRDDIPDLIGDRFENWQEIK